ncbi:hypothetical protein FIV42_04770 [Persicimonas caeni]|uniref:Uncharacterized protein n=1 Tax=Persicimonas caeni TaxID=2292766 RepID=A0A4Y6PP22_PERCE|nr:hypothetical protein [Persicimonas caeni]QDG50072.1 hypothetical protein FIV42_04770 [Persicimonas caeni]QED31293.1 hypothetical protein FRD00_04765 [Persicimonas caeni]
MKSQEESGEESGLDIDREWSEARKAAERDAMRRFMRQHTAKERQKAAFAEVSPYVLLYSGFLLGPAATFGVAFLLIARNFEARAAIFALGLCGTVWGLIQAATFGLAGQWSTVELQILRTGANFLLGVLLLWFLAKQTDVPLAHDRQTVVNTVVLGLLLVLGYSFASPDLLVWLGR